MFSIITYLSLIFKSAKDSRNFFIFTLEPFYNLGYGIITLLLSLSSLTLIFTKMIYYLVVLVPNSLY
jgi:hypothetical protein